MKHKIFKLCMALISLLIGFAIVHSLSPQQELVSSEKRPEQVAFKLNNDTEIAMDCVYGVAPYEVHFSAYQRPEKKLAEVDYQQAFCDKLPGLDLTLITLDFMDWGLREKPVVLKFIHHQQKELSAETLTGGSIIKESFHDGIPRGFIQSRVEFSKAGFYTLVVEFGGGVVLENEIVRIPFEVGTGL